jgi:hypothetical protein
MRIKRISLAIIAFVILSLWGVVISAAQSKLRKAAVKSTTFDEQAVVAEYKKKCSICHKPDGKGGNGIPDFTDSGFNKSRSDAQLFLLELCRLRAAREVSLGCWRLRHNFLIGVRDVQHCHFDGH